METEIRNAIWEMLASGNTANEIKDVFSLVDIDNLIDDVYVEYIEQCD